MPIVICCSQLKELVDAGVLKRSESKVTDYHHVGTFYKQNLLYANINFCPFCGVKIQLQDEPLVSLIYNWLDRESDGK